MSPAERSTAPPPQYDEASGSRPIRRAQVVWNESSGATDSATLDELRSRFREAGIEIDVISGTAPGGPRAAARRALSANADAIVAAGGDGTVNAVASAVAGTGIPMGVLPLGTLNHFAKDLRLPPDLSGAIHCIGAGHVAAVDAAEVNGQLFVNNSSLGFYPRVIKHRDRLRARMVLSKGVAMLYALRAVFRRYPQVEVTLEVAPGAAGRTVHRVTPFVFVGNNRYALHLMALGTRRRLDRGELCAYVAHRPGRFGLVRLLVMALFRRLKHAKDFDSFALQELTVSTPKRRLVVSIDGELLHLAPPLRYRIRPGALKVIVPKTS
jgi:diacylglycerol kinase family enzyme